jgi:hypothetical protein
MLTIRFAKCLSTLANNKTQLAASCYWSRYELWQFIPFRITIYSHFYHKRYEENIA